MFVPELSLTDQIKGDQMEMRIEWLIQQKRGRQELEDYEDVLGILDENDLQLCDEIADRFLKQEEDNHSADDTDNENDDSPDDENDFNEDDEDEQRLDAGDLHTRSQPTDTTASYETLNSQEGAETRGRLFLQLRAR
jgi:hypothetical protein